MIIGGVIDTTGDAMIGTTGARIGAAAMVTGTGVTGTDGIEAVTGVASVVKATRQGQSSRARRHAYDGSIRRIRGPVSQAAATPTGTEETPGVRGSQTDRSTVDG